MIRWANSKEDTKVWIKQDRGDWFLSANNIAWNKDNQYIVNDGWAELRKAEADGKIIEARLTPDIWSEHDLNESFRPSYYRVKPDEPTYYYQWEKLYPEGRIITSEYLTDERADYDGYQVGDGWRRIESSKRTWEKG